LLLFLCVRVVLFALFACALSLPRNTAFHRRRFEAFAYGWTKQATQKQAQKTKKWRPKGGKILAVFLKFFTSAKNMAQIYFCMLVIFFC
jgi:hypothetical protein